VQSYLTFFFPTSTVGILGNFCFYCQSEKRKKKIHEEDAKMVKKYDIDQ
jgi:hypothetical protein